MSDKRHSTDGTHWVKCNCRTLRPDEWYSVEDLAEIGISEKRLSKWRKSEDRGGKGLLSVKLKKILYYGGDIHEILLSERTPG